MFIILNVNLRIYIENPFLSVKLSLQFDFLLLHFGFTRSISSNAVSSYKISDCNWWFAFSFLHNFLSIFWNAILLQYWHLSCIFGWNLKNLVLLFDDSILQSQLFQNDHMLQSGAWVWGVSLFQLTAEVFVLLNITNDPDGLFLIPEFVDLFSYKSATLIYCLCRLI